MSNIGTQCNEALNASEKKIIELFADCLSELDLLSTLRSSCKLSTNRVSGITREVKDLLKVFRATSHSEQLIKSN